MATVSHQLDCLDDVPQIVHRARTLPHAIQKVRMHRQLSVKLRLPTESQPKKWKWPNYRPNMPEMWPAQQPISSE